MENLEIKENFKNIKMLCCVKGYSKSLYDKDISLQCLLYQFLSSYLIYIEQIIKGY